MNGITPPFDSSGKTCLNNWFDLVAIWTSSQDNKIVIVSSTSSQKLAENLLSDWSLQFMRSFRSERRGTCVYETNHIKIKGSYILSKCIYGVVFGANRFLAKVDVASAVTTPIVL